MAVLAFREEGMDFLPFFYPGNRVVVTRQVARGGGRCVRSRADKVARRPGFSVKTRRRRCVRACVFVESIFHLACRGPVTGECVCIVCAA